MNGVSRSIFYLIRECIKAVKVYRNWMPLMLSHFYSNKRILIAELRNGLKFKIRPKSGDNFIIREVFGNKIYHQCIDKLTEDSIVIDIGGHIGTFSVLVAKQNNGVIVYSYEPFEENFQLLRENVVLNGMEQRVRMFNCAVGGVKGERIVFSTLSSGASSLYEQKGRKILIKVLSLKDIFADHTIPRCDLLKVDCEGAEYEILYSTPKEIFAKIRLIAMEFHEQYGTGKGKELKQFLERQGFDTNMTGETSGLIYAEKVKDTK
jgi:FkbM family methyltransferase